MNNHLFKFTLNFLAVVLLIGLIATPIYFAKNFAKVSGVKSESKYLVVSQIEKFPGMSLTQQGDQYTISFTKLGPSQAYLGVLILNNPTNENQTYSIEVQSGETQVFFGQDLDNQLIRISVPSQTSTPISLMSEGEPQSQSVQFNITANSE